MVRVMEQQEKFSAVAPPGAESFDQGGLVPFMRNDNVSVIQCLVEIERGQIIRPQGHARNQRCGFLQVRLPVIAHRVDAAPAVPRLIYGDPVSSADELARNTAQEMGVAMVPARRERMIKQ